METSKTGNKLVLVVESDEVTNRLMCDLLKGNGYPYISASSFGDATTRTRGIVPDVIVSAGRLPDCSGLELCRWVKSRELLKRVPVMIVSDRPEIPHRLSAFLAGAQKYLCRPFRNDDFIESIHFLAGMNSDACRTEPLFDTAVL